LESPRPPQTDQSQKIKEGNDQPPIFLDGGTINTEKKLKIKRREVRPTESKRLAGSRGKEISTQASN